MVFLLSAVSILFCMYSKASASCNRSCGETQLPYPFGVSSDCEIKLDCSLTGKVLIGEFHVLHITPRSLVLDVPGKCNRSIEDFGRLFDKNYAVAIENQILLGNCSRGVRQGCSISTDVMNSRVKLEGCNPNGEVISCYANDNKHEHTDFMNFTHIKQSTCRLLVTSLSYDYLTNGSDVVSFEIQRLELGWWLEVNETKRGCPTHKCSHHANCTHVLSPVGRPGFRCECERGYVGDGFLAGDGCRKDSSKCNPSKYMSGDCGGTTRVGVLIGGIVAGAALMVGLALLWWLIRRRSSFKSRTNARHLLAEAAGNSSVPFYSYKEIERATSSFSDRHRIGTGAYGTVYAGKLHNDEWVAIKKIRHREADGVEQIMNEIKLLSSVSHPNLVRLLGCCIERGEQILVYEFMPNGTLSEHLQKERSNGLPWAVRLNIATETAQAIAHLHSADNPIYHRDIKSSNILLDYNFKSKVADFGLSRLALPEYSHISTAPQGTPGYLDPQYHQNFHLSDKSDVYSFGVVLVEIITALKVVDFTRPNSEVNLAALAVEKIGKGRIDEITDPTLEPDTDAWTLSSVHKVSELAFRCLAFHKDMRPSMKEVATELENIRLGLLGPLEENECLGSSFSSPSFSSEKSQSLKAIHKGGIDSRRLVLSVRSNIMIPLDELEDSSPMSVQEAWFSEQSSPSADSLLNNTTQ